jgi:hypothetical protein
MLAAPIINVLLRRGLTLFDYSWIYLVFIRLLVLAQRHERGVPEIVVAPPHQAFERPTSEDFSQQHPHLRRVKPDLSCRSLPPADARICYRDRRLVPGSRPVFTNTPVPTCVIY